MLGETIFLSVPFWVRQFDDPLERDRAFHHRDMFTVGRGR